MKRLLATGAAAGFLTVALAAAPALAAYPPDPGGNSTQSTGSVRAGGAVDFTFGTQVPFLPGATVTITSSCVAPDGTVFAGPSTTTTANAQGLAAVSLTFSQPGVCTVTATGAGNVPGGIVTATSKVTITAQGGGGGGGGDKPAGGGTAGGGGTTTGGGALATTGANNNTLTIAAVGGGLLLAGVGAVAVARRREQSNS